MHTLSEEELKRRVQAAYDAGVRDGRAEIVTEAAMLRLAHDLAAGQGERLSALVFKLPQRPNGS